MLSDDEADGAARPSVAHPQLRLDELLVELQARLSTVLKTRDRVHGLLEAVLAVGSDLDLQVVLRRIVEAARSLVDASFGALGVLDDAGNGLSQFLVVGIDEDTATAIGSLPEGTVCSDSSSETLARCGSRTCRSMRPRSGSLPGIRRCAHFLACPYGSGTVVFGNLYLTDKRGGAPFDEEDEAVVLALAAAAGVAVQNARLYAESRQRERWLEATAEVSTALLSGTDPEDVLTLVARLAREVTRALWRSWRCHWTRTGCSWRRRTAIGAEHLRGRLLDRADSALGEVLAARPRRRARRTRPWCSADPPMARPLPRGASRCRSARPGNPLAGFWP